MRTFFQIPTVLVKRKYHRSKLFKKQQQWIIGKVDTKSKGVFIRMVEKRNTEKIEKFLVTWVKKASVIHTHE